MLKSEQLSTTQHAHLEKDTQVQNDPVVDYPPSGNLHYFVEQQVERTPDAIAVRFEDAQITYKELNQRANLLARRLDAAGVGPDVLVGVCMERSLELIIALLAVLKAGGAYVPLDPSYPQDRLTYMIADAHVPLVLTQGDIAARISLQGVPTIALDTIKLDTVAQTGAENLDKLIEPEHLAYMIYTSGSTGKPKGAMLPHSNVVRLMEQTQDWFHFGPQDSWTFFHSYAFDFSVWEIWGALLTGGSLVIVPYWISREPDKFYQLLCQESVTILNQTPSAFLQLMQAEAREPISSLLALRAVIFGGEALDLSLLASWTSRHDDQHPQLINMYGITETTVHVTYRPITQQDIAGHTGSVIGIAIPDLTCYVLDEQQQLVPIGVPGELYVGGQGLARGYWQRPDITAERFIPHPFSSIPGERLYRTGDSVRVLVSGELEYLGRNDQQVKLRGFRIELGEIEAGLQQQAGIRQAIVIVREDNPGDKRLVAYLLTQGDPPSTETLRAALKEKLPDYMVPAAFVFLEAFPLSPSGKIDRRALPIPDNAPNRQADTLIAPRTPMEETLANIWANVLNLQQISVDDNFFELGGHSLLVTQVISRLRQSLHVEVPNRNLFEMPTIAMLAQHIDTLLQLPPQAATETGLALTSMVRPGMIPASFSQQSLWFLQQLDPTSVAYNIPLAYQLEGPLVISALQQSLNALVHRHETLRTIFADQDGQAIQVIMPEYSLDLPVIDMQGLDGTIREKYIQQLTRQESQTPFDLETGPLIRVQLLRVDELSNILLLNIHHIVFDGWSIDVLLRDLTSLYQTHVQGTPAALAALSIQYADYALWQEQLLHGQVLQDHLTYWQQHLTGAPKLITLPPDRPRPTILTEAGAQQKIILPTQLYQELKTLSQREGVTLFMTLLATFQVVFMRSSGQTDLVLGAPVANRSRTEVEDLLGYFVNTLALRTDLSGNPSFHQLLVRVRDMTLQAFAHQDISFEQVIQSLQIERSTSYTSLFQVMFSMQNAAPSTLQAGELAWVPIELTSTSAKFDLTFEVQEREDGLQIRIEYNTSLYDASTIERLLTHWQVLLAAVIKDPTQPIESLPMLTATEREQLLVTWNETAVDYPEARSLHQLVEQQVQRTPEATAISFEEQQITYQELDQRANQLAHHLDALGVGPDVLVGVCMERSVELVVSILAVLKAGGAYVPLDPAYPQDRLAYMIADAQVPLVLTQTKASQHIAATGVLMLYLDDQKLFADHQNVHTLDKPVQLDNLAYLIYTSGSTGKPKGAMNTHRNIYNQLLWRQSHSCQITAQDRILHKTAFSFDVSVWEFFWPLITGASIVIAIPEGHRDPTYLKAVMIEQAITTMHFVPAMLQVFLQEANLERCTNLRQVMSGGEALTPELQKRFFERFPKHVRLYNMYGPAEAAIDVTAWECQRESDQRNIPIGYPISNTQLYILDPKLQPVPIGVPGDLYIGGMSVARGYHRRPEMTAERFIPNPFSAEPGARLYTTGDQARYRADGAIEYLGRVDSQIKLRGMRIELGEIETALQQQPSIQQAITIIREDTPGNKLLVAYLRTSGEQPTRETLRTALKESLPNYMVPTAFVFVDAFPLTPSGKIDRRALPVPDMSQTTIKDNSDDKPSKIMHYQLLNIWEELLATSPISIKDNFFDLGGHSLLAARMLARIEQVFGKKISLSTLFAGPTIEDLTRVLMQQTQTSPKSPLIPVQVAGSGSKKPFFFLHGDWSGGAYYCFKLARKAGSDQPFYVIEPSVFPEDQEIPSIEGQAASHLELVRSVQPEGPYYLGGYCNGSIIAYEMAQQLQEQGEQVKFLAMIDPPSESLAKNFAHFFNNTLHLSERPQWKAYLYTRHIFIRKVRPLLLRLSKTVDEQLTKGIQVSVEKDQAFTRLLPSMKTLRADYGSIFAWAFQHYTRKPYHGKITFIWARDELAAETNNFWNDRAQVEEAESHVITGSHYGILTDEIEAFAECLGTELQKAQAQNAGNTIL